MIGLRVSSHRYKETVLEWPHERRMASERVELDKEAQWCRFSGASDGGGSGGCWPVQGRSL